MHLHELLVTKSDEIAERMDEAKRDPSVILTFAEVGIVKNAE